MSNRLKICSDYNFLGSGKLQTTEKTLSKDSNVNTKHTQDFRKIYLHMKA